MNNLKNYTILYVEDDLNVQQNITEYLKRIFNKVIVASDGKEALELYQQNKPDGMLLDVDIPYINGLYLAKEIRKIDKRVSIIMLTAYAEQEKLLKATELKLVKYLVKPVDLVNFKEALKLMSQEIAENNQEFENIGDNYLWHKTNKILYNGSTKVRLSRKEQLLLELLLKNRANSVSFTTIMAEVWADEFEREISFNSVKNLVSSLRKKLPKHCIISVYSQGYIIN